MNGVAKEISRENNPALDWLTVAGQDPDGDCELFEAICTWQDALLPFHKERDWKLLGYAGRAVGPLRLGFRGDRDYIIQISGAAADDALRRIPLLAKMHVTRIDLQATVENDQGENAIRAMWLYLNAIKDNMPNYPDLTYIGGPTGDTLYIGQRKSAKMVRIYDKGAEMGLGRDEVIRYEIEFKKGKAQAAWEGFVAAPNRTDWICGVIQRELEKVAIFRQFGSGCLIEIKAEKKTTTVDRQLAWLGRCVRPVVVQLLQAGYYDKVKETLFGET